MDRPDLAALAADVKDIEGRIEALRDGLKAAQRATLGEYDQENEREISPGNGDVYEIYEAALKRAGEARLAIGTIVGDLAAQQGFREFEAAGIAP